jgi:hypothetical protein
VPAAVGLGVIFERRAVVEQPAVVTEQDVTGPQGKLGAQ